MLYKHLKNALRRERRAKKKLGDLKDVINDAYIQLKDQCEARATAEALLTKFRNGAEQSARQACQLQQQVLTLKERIDQDSEMLASQAIELASQRDLASNFKERHAVIYRKRDALRKRLARQNNKHSKSKLTLQCVDNSIHRYNLKEDAGAIRLEVQIMIRKLACQGVSTKRVTEIIKIVGEALGIEVTGSISRHSIAQIMLVGLVQAQMQIVQKINQAHYVSICGDETTIKNQQHEAKSVFIQLPVYTSNDNPESTIHSPGQAPVLRKLGVKKAPSHTAEQQSSGWINILGVSCDRLQRSPLGKGGHFTSAMVAPKLRGVLTDQAIAWEELGLKPPFTLLNKYESMGKAKETGRTCSTGTSRKTPV